jgi:hypothetical protein
MQTSFGVIQTVAQGTPKSTCVPVVDSTSSCQFYGDSRGTFCTPATTLPGSVHVGQSCSYVVDRFTVFLLVVFAFNLALPISQFSQSIARGTLGIALACVLMSFLMMITRSKAVPQVIGFLSMENGLFFAATSATYGMPMVVELGVALDLLIAAFIFGIFFFHINTTFDSLDVEQMAKLKEED